MAKRKDCAVCGERNIEPTARGLCKRCSDMSLSEIANVAAGLRPEDSTAVEIVEEIAEALNAWAETAATPYGTENMVAVVTSGKGGWREYRINVKLVNVRDTMLDES